MHALERILLFRRLTEQQALRKLERATQILRAATTACERQAKIVTEQRASLAHSWLLAGSVDECQPAQMQNSSDSDASGSEIRKWLLEEAALEFSGWNHAQLEQICAAEAKRIQPLVEQYIECRRSLRQTERLLEQQAELARVEQGKRSQAEADDWFLQQTLRRSRNQQCS
jgi:hypothetical protein